MGEDYVGKHKEFYCWGSKWGTGRRKCTPLCRKEFWIEPVSREGKKVSRWCGEGSRFLKYPVTKGWPVAILQEVWAASGRDRCRATAGDQQGCGSLDPPLQEISRDTLWNREVRVAEVESKETRLPDRWRVRSRRGQHSEQKYPEKQQTRC